VPAAPEFTGGTVNIFATSVDPRSGLPVIPYAPFVVVRSWTRAETTIFAVSAWFALSILPVPELGAAIRETIAENIH
jgi:hypothetical protein